MTRALLDVNVLIALLDRDHHYHLRARDWLSEDTNSSWASCAITQNGLVRILSQPRYTSPVSVDTARLLLRRACADSLHEFWACDLSVLDTRIGAGTILRSQQVTDVYLLALATAHNGRLVTFDKSIPLKAVPDATRKHLVVL